MYRKRLRCLHSQHHIADIALFLRDCRTQSKRRHPTGQIVIQANRKTTIKLSSTQNNWGKILIKSESTHSRSLALTLLRTSQCGLVVPLLILLNDANRWLVCFIFLIRNYLCFHFHEYLLDTAVVTHAAHRSKTPTLARMHHARAHISSSSISLMIWWIIIVSHGAVARRRENRIKMLEMTIVEKHNVTRTKLNGPDTVTNFHEFIISRIAADINLIHFGEGTRSHTHTHSILR